MSVDSTKRRHRGDEGRRPNKRPKVKRQRNYHSSSEDDDQDPDLDVARDAPARAVPKKAASTPMPRSILKHKVGVGARPVDESTVETESAVGKAEKSAMGSATSDSNDDVFEDVLEEQKSDDVPMSDEDEDGVGDDDGDGDDDDNEEDDAGSERSSTAPSDALRARKKRNDPEAFATSISKILDTKLTAAKRRDPVLSRSKSAADANKSLADSRLEGKARAQIRAEKKRGLENGRVRDVLGLETPAVDTGALLEEEKRLKKTAQRGVVKLFNAVRAAQVKAEDGGREARNDGVVGMQQREERVTEMSKQGFLDLISSGGRKTTAA